MKGDPAFCLLSGKRVVEFVGGDANLARLVAKELNLGGIVTPGVKTPAKAGNRVLLLNGVPAARLLGDDLELLGRTERIGSSEAERYLRVVRSLPRSGVR
jgi:hypothetical protein